MGPFGFWRPREISNLILRTLERHDIPAAGFVVEEKIDLDPPSLVILEDWLKRGHVLGNNTYAYQDLNELSPDDFLSYVGQGHRFLRRAARQFDVDFRYFRFPLLHYGETDSKRKEVAKRLFRTGYKVVPVTVKTSDSWFNGVYLDVEQNEEAKARLQEIYLKHLSDSLDYSERQSDTVFGRQIRHILQLRAGISTATFLEEVIGLLKQRGYQFISIEEALADPLYQTEEKYVGRESLTFTDRVAATRNLPYDPQAGELRAGQIERLMKGGLP